MCCKDEERKEPCPKRFQPEITDSGSRGLLPVRWPRISWERTKKPYHFGISGLGGDERKRHRNCSTDLVDQRKEGGNGF